MLIGPPPCPWVSLCTTRMQAFEASCFGWHSRPSCVGKGEARNYLFGVDGLLHKKYWNGNASSHVSLLSKYLISTSPLLGTRSLQVFSCHGETAICKADSIYVDGVAHVAPYKNAQESKGRKGAKNKAVSIEISPQHRAELEQLGVEERVLLKYMQRETTNVSVNDAIRCVSALMEIIGLSGSTINSVLYKCPSLLNLHPYALHSSIGFLTELGLEKGEALRILSCLRDHELHEMQLSIDYLASIGLSSENILLVLQKRPQALNAKFEDVKYTIECLLDFGILLKDLSRLLAKVPDLFSSSMRKNLRSRLGFFKQVGLYGASLGKGIARRPNLLQFELEYMKQAYEYLSEFLSSSDMSKLVCRFPEVLLIDPKRKMEPMVNYLLQLGVKQDNLRKVLVRRPQLLGYTIGGLEPTLQYLKEIGVTDQVLGKIITASPQVLTLNCEERLKPVIEYLHSIGLQEKADMERLLVRNAQLLCYSIEKNITPKINFFIDIGLEKKDVIKILVLFPSMFGQNIELTLEPKYRFLVDVMKRSPKEITDFPQYFGYSLEKRIRPRFEKLAERGITNISLPSMLACVETDFVGRYLVGTPPSRGPYNVKRGPQINVNRLT